MWGCAEGVDSKSPPPCAAPSRDIWTDLSNLETVFLTFSESSKQTEELDPFQTDSIPSHIFLHWKKSWKGIASSLIARVHSFYRLEIVREGKFTLVIGVIPFR